MKNIVVISLVVALACTPIRPRPSPTAPINACPDHPCSAFSPGSPTCVSGVCLEPPTPTAVHLVLVVAFPVDSLTLPGRTFGLSFANLRTQTADGGTADKLPVSTPGATWPILPKLQVASPAGRYLVQETTAVGLGWNLGNGDIAFTTTIPVHVTYRPLWPPDIIGAEAGVQSPMDAIAAGLPLYPDQANSIPTPALDGIYVGPAHGPPIAFQTDVQADLSYEQTIAPDPPFDQAFPPDVSIVHLVAGLNSVTRTQDTLPDKAHMNGMLGLPMFDLSRAEGLDGWTAHLRDATTKRPISPTRPLSGTTTANVLLPTSHHPPNGDAFSNAELVMTPPAAANLPTFVVRPPFAKNQQTYVPLPPAMKVRGRIDWTGRNAVSADVVFEATGIYASVPRTELTDAGVADASGDGGADATSSAGPPYTLQPNFEFTAQATAEPDPTIAGTSSYEIILPRGAYRVIVRPKDGSQPTPYEVSVFEPVDTGSVDEPRPPALFVGLSHRIAGTAAVADGRALSGATIEAIPVHCSTPSGLVRATNDSPSCMPRYQFAMTAEDGTFSLSLDPGDYVIRAEPADGTQLPWVSQPMHVPGSNAITLTIPAPVYRGFELHDDLGKPVAAAVVRMFTMANGPAIEVGRAITNTSGRFDMYLDPRVQ